ncbi:MAG TPA: hypothetical protein VET88_14005 [Gammaproteobacteria bacterium]|nr:hypothetical protein [Gammaproteobacteria bacterium]
MTPEQVNDWVKRYPLEPVHVDCVTAVMLKILDGKCKMSTQEKTVMTLLYDQIKAEPGILFHADMHRLIATARDGVDDDLGAHIYEKRVLAESTLSRPVMKAFKAMIRQRGLFTAES